MRIYEKNDSLVDEFNPYRALHQRVPVPSHNLIPSKKELEWKKLLVWETLLEQSISKALEDFVIQKIKRNALGVFEIGCGTGRFLTKLLSSGFRGKIYGIDNSAEAISLPQFKLNLVNNFFENNLMVGDIIKENVWCKNLQPNVCILGNTWVGISPLNAQQILGQIRNHIPPGGKLYIDIYSGNVEESFFEKVFYDANIPLFNKRIDRILVAIRRIRKDSILIEKTFCTIFEKDVNPINFSFDATNHALSEDLLKEQIIRAGFSLTSFSFPSQGPWEPILIEAHGA